MRDRFSRIAMILLLLLLAALVAQPYLQSWFFSATTPRLVTARGSLAEAEEAAIALFERIAPSVVQVIVIPQEALYRNIEGQVNAGSGFVWDAAGHIVTNDHVVSGAAAVSIRFPSGDTVPAVVIGRAPNYDLAVLRLNARTALPPPVPIGRSEDLKVGQAAFAIGNPFGLDQTLTTGIVSALKRRLPTITQREIADVIQTDAAINPGNSGGPLLDSSGRLIGVNTAIFSPSGTNAGVGFAIPVDTVNRIVPDLIRNGRVPTPGIGILVADETLTARLGLEGVLVARTIPGTPAAEAGLRGIDPVNETVGDLIIAARGEPVRRFADLVRAIEETGVGNTIPLTIVRGGQTATVELDIVDVGER